MILISTANGLVIQLVRSEWKDWTFQSWILSLTLVYFSSWKLASADILEPSFVHRGNHQRLRRILFLWMDSDFHINKRARLNSESMSSIPRSSDIDTFSKMSYSPETKPLPADLNEFLANPYNFRVTEDFLSRITLDVSVCLLLQCVLVDLLGNFNGRIGSWESFDSLH